MNDAEKAMIFHTLAMLLKLEAERCDHEDKQEILNANATLLQDIGIRLGGSMIDIRNALTDGNEEIRRINTLARVEAELEPEVH